MPLIVYQDARVGMEGFSAIGQHARAFGGQRVEGVGFGRGLALAGGQPPVETTEGDADGPGEQGKVVSGR
ncbi:MAG: hypothetical protein EA420_15025 [Candidatus Competibacteraceae bacterium]|nr:MAG: hypothetical protein EA420_15025 [Candidatus Competibacteraceae bacterium]